MTSVRNDTQTTATTVCPQCGSRFTPLGRRRWCSDACRQSAWRLRRAAPRPTQPAKIDTVYECPQCQTATWAPNAATTATPGPAASDRADPAPHCDDIVAVIDLVADNQYSPPQNHPIRPAPTHTDPTPAKVDAATKWGNSMSNSGQLG